MNCNKVTYENVDKFITFRLCLDTSHFGSIAQKCETRYDKVGYFLKKNK